MKRVRRGSSSDGDGLAAALEAARARLAGVVDAASAARHVLAMLFFKYVCDVWHDQRDECHRLWGRFPDLVAELLRHQRFVVSDATSFHALHHARHVPGNGARIDAALRALEETNLASLRGVFHGVTFDALPFDNEARKDAALRLLLDDLAGPALDLRPGTAGALERASLAGDLLAGEAASMPDAPGIGDEMPVLLAELLARLLAPRPGEAICDPLCGGGSTLAHCATWLRKRSRGAACALFGQERRAGLRAVGRMNLLLHGLDNHRIESGDVLASPRHLDSHGRLRCFDVGVAQLPFGPSPWKPTGEADTHRRLGRGRPPRARTDHAYILHMLETLRPGSGRMAVVAPHGVLFRGGAEQRIRERLIDENLLDAVIGLPPKLFPGTSRACVVLLLRRARSDDKVLFVDASRSFQAGRRCNRLRVRDVDRIVTTVEARRPVDASVRLVERDALREQRHNLHLPRYLPASAAQDAAPAWQVLQSERLRLHAELSVLQAEVDQQLQDLAHG